MPIGAWLGQGRGRSMAKGPLPPGPAHTFNLTALTLVGSISQHAAKPLPCLLFARAGLCPRVYCVAVAKWTKGFSPRRTRKEKGQMNPCWKGTRSPPTASPEGWHGDRQDPVCTRPGP